MLVIWSSRPQSCHVLVTFSCTLCKIVSFHGEQLYKNLLELSTRIIFRKYCSSFPSPSSLDPWARPPLSPTLPWGGPRNIHAQILSVILLQSTLKIEVACNFETSISCPVHNVRRPKSRFCLVLPSWKQRTGVYLPPGPNRVIEIGDNSYCAIDLLYGTVKTEKKDICWLLNMCLQRNPTDR
jgi:hypothetical protein